MQFGTNHLGHFALTGLLLDNLLPVRRLAGGDGGQHRAQHARPTIHFDDLQWERRYNRVAAYGQSKLANLMFTYELQHRLAARRRRETIAVAAHPGGSDTELSPQRPDASCIRRTGSSGR